MWCNKTLHDEYMKTNSKDDPSGYLAGNYLRWLEKYCKAADLLRIKTFIKNETFSGQFFLELGEQLAHLSIEGKEEALDLLKKLSSYVAAASLNEDRRLLKPWLILARQTENAKLLLIALEYLSKIRDRYINYLADECRNDSKDYCYPTNIKEIARN